MLLEKYSIGIGDRFGHQGIAQLKALQKARADGLIITPVWNKSKREHVLIGSTPADVRLEADNAVKALKWVNSYFVDADHISLNTVDPFLPYSDFFTIDVADFINQPCDDNEQKVFAGKAAGFLGNLTIPGIPEPFLITKDKIEKITCRYLTAIKEASKIYKHILKSKGEGSFITEVSLDENDEPQTPEELFFILLGLSLEGIPVQTIAPKFTGRFNKGVDYVGDTKQFTREFENDILVIRYAVELFNLPQSLKLSVHSGSDKFSIYESIYKITKKHNSGIHLKTAGTTWLEELIGLAEAGNEGLELAKEIYLHAYNRIEELSKPYHSVVDIRLDKLPLPEEVNKWPGENYVRSLRHNQSDPMFNNSFRQLLHLSYKIAAEMEIRYINVLKKYEDVISKNVTENIYDRHIKPVFLGEKVKSELTV